MQNFGAEGFFIIKMGLTIIVLGIINYIIINSNCFKYLGNKRLSAICLGIIVSNIYVSISNIFVLYGEKSFYLPQLNIFQIISLIFFSIIIILFLKNITNIKKVVHSNLYKVIRISLCMKRILLVLGLLFVLCFMTGLGSADPKYLACDCGDNSWCGSPEVSTCHLIPFDAHHGCLYASCSSNTTVGCCYGFAVGSPFKNYKFRGELGNDALGGAIFRGHTGGSARFVYTITDSLDVTKNQVTNWWIEFTEIQSAAIYYDEIGYSPLIISHIHGDRYCDSTTIFYIKDDADIYQQIDQSYVDTYSFSITEGYEYLIVFDAYNFYYFTAGDSDIVRNFNNCGSAGDPTDPVPEDDPYNPNPRNTYIRLYFYDNCNNLIRETAGTYYSANDPWEQAFYAPLGFIDIDYDDQAYLEMWVDSAVETLYYNISNPKSADILTYIISNPIISWNNNIYVIDGNTSLPIESALVTFFQDCVINPLTYPPRHKFTDNNGFVNFDQCELDSFSLSVGATNYQSFFDSDISSLSLNAFQLEQTIKIILYPLEEEENETIYNYTDYDVYVKFKDITGNYTSLILDTDNYVDLYYFNNNSEDTSMTLKFQKYSITTGIIDLLSWEIPIGEKSYKRILKSNYTDISYLYIGHLYNYSIDNWDRTKYLTIRNETDEIDLDYENLTSFVWFKNKNVEGSIDYREDINIIAYANTSYVGLFIISLELYDNSEYVEHTNLTWADFISADLKNYYEWNPLHSYTNGHNYTVRMHGYDYYLLDMDYINATDYRKNKLTIIVKNQFGTDLSNAFIYLEDYGSLSTGVNNYNSYENLDNGYYRYKATKPDYIGTGWSDITISDSDEIVTYVLTSTESEAGSAMQPQKMDESELQNIYLIIMAFLLIFVIIGGLKYAL
jgi:hypothetical protein